MILKLPSVSNPAAAPCRAHGPLFFETLRTCEVSEQQGGRSWPLMTGEELFGHGPLRQMQPHRPPGLACARKTWAKCPLMMLAVCSVACGGQLAAPSASAVVDAGSEAAAELDAAR